MHCMYVRKYVRSCTLHKKRAKLFAYIKKKQYFCTRFCKNREVAQLVAHYVRDVGVGCSSHLFSTKKDIHLGILFCR